jgi:hypothetical protein
LWVIYMYITVYIYIIYIYISPNLCWLYHQFLWVKSADPWLFSLVWAPTRCPSQWCLLVYKAHENQLDITINHRNLAMEVPLHHKKPFILA